MTHDTSIDVIRLLEDSGEYLFGKATQEQDTVALKLVERINEALGYKIDAGQIRRKHELAKKYNCASRN